VSKFFGESGLKGMTIHSKGATAKSTATTTKPTQSGINQFMLDGFLVKTIEKNKRTNAKAKEAKESKDPEPEPEPKAIKAKAKPKNEIINYK
jgi:hypothetical protein